MLLDSLNSALSMTLHIRKTCVSSFDHTATRTQEFMHYESIWASPEAAAGIRLIHQQLRYINSCEQLRSELLSLCKSGLALLHSCSTASEQEDGAAHAVFTVGPSSLVGIGPVGCPRHKPGSLNAHAEQRLSAGPSGCHHDQMSRNRASGDRCTLTQSA